MGVANAAELQQKTGKADIYGDPGKAETVGFENTVHIIITL